MFIDIHSHVNFKAFENDGDEVIERALENGVGMILVGSQNSTSKRAVEYAEKYTDKPVWAAIGLHPLHLQEIKLDENEVGAKELGFTTRAEKFNYEYYKELALHPKVVAIGEVGLDYFRIENKESRIKQIDTFKKQIELALKTKKALMVHCRQAHDDCIKILKQYYSLQTTNYSLKNGDIHFFEGTFDEAKEYFKIGFTVSFNGVITFPPSASLRRAGKNATHHQELVKALPLENMLLETDSPYITPEPHRGKRNEPLYVKYVAQKIAELKGMSLEEVERVTTETAKKVFGLKI